MSLETFSRFSPMHAIVVLVSITLAVLLITVGKRVGTAGRRRIRLGYGWIALLLQIAHNTYWIVFREGSGNEWPLHLCDLAGFVAVAAFLSGSKSLGVLLYFWGSALSSLAFVIPVLTAGPGTVEFWSFWLSHWAIVVGGVYMVLVERAKPTLRSAIVTALLTIGYGLIMVPVNQSLGTNYAYVGRDSPPAEFLGAWPIPRLALLGLSVAVLVLLAYAAFRVVLRRWVRREGSPRS